MEDGFQIQQVPGVQGISFEKIISDANFCSLVKMTANVLMQKPYLQLGDWFKSLTNNDLTILEFMVEAATKDDIESLENIIVLVEMLSRAEGADAPTLDEAHKNVNYFTVLVTVVSLARRGIVEVFYENMSFGPDMADKEVARVLTGM